MKRIKALDVIKCLAIFLVIWGHVLQHLYDLDYNDQPVYRVIYSFHMSLFMMISGYFAVSSMKMTFCKITVKKIRQLLLPCICWSIIWWGGQNLLHSILGHQNFSFDLLYNSLLRHFWFLKCLFLCYILFYLCSKLELRYSFKLALFVVLCQFINVYNLPQMSVCFACGIILKLRRDILFLIQRYSLSIGLFFLLLLFFWNKNISTYRFDVLSQMSVILRGGWDGYSLFCEAYRIIIGLTGSLFIIGFGITHIKNENNSKLLDILSSFGQYTLGIYLLQSILLEAALKKYVHLNMMGLLWFNIAAPIISLAILVTSVFAIKQIRKSKTLSFVLLGM